MSAVHHMAFRTRDVSGLARFYQEWLGLTLMREALPRSIWLSLGQESVLMLETKAEDEPDIPKGSREFFAIRLTPEARVALRVRLEAAGRLEAETEHTLYFRDPDGRRVGVSSYEFGLG